MRVALATPYADVRAADLVLALDAPPAEPLRTLTLELAGIPVELGVLGHSHQIVAGGLRETVACRPGAPGALPARHAGLHAGRRYAFTAAVVPLDRAAVRALVEEVAADPLGIVGVFPGDADAFTALRARAMPDGACWETFHAYPQAGELVVTTGELVAA